MFTVAQAITRLSGGVKNLLITSNGTMSAGQILQRINEILSTWYEEATWRGVHATVALTSTAGIITLAEAYLRIDGLQVTSTGKCGPVEIKSQQWAFQSGGPGYFDVTNGYCYVAIDLGDNASGLRRYQLTGTAADLDALTFYGLARKRFVYITDTSTVVTPDCYSALELSVRAMNAADEQANGLSKDLWAQAFAKLDADLGEFEKGNDWPFMQLDPACAVDICNLV